MPDAGRPVLFGLGGQINAGSYSEALARADQWVSDRSTNQAITTGAVLIGGVVAPIFVGFVASEISLFASSPSAYVLENAYGMNAAGVEVPGLFTEAAVINPAVGLFGLSAPAAVSTVDNFVFLADDVTRGVAQANGLVPPPLVAMGTDIPTFPAEATLADFSLWMDDLPSLDMSGVFGYTRMEDAPGFGVYAWDDVPDRKSVYATGTNIELGSVDAVAAKRVYQQSYNSQETLVIGRQVDTEVGSQLGMRRLDDPDWKPNFFVNDAWMQGGIDAGKPFYIGSEISFKTLRSDNPLFKTTVFFRELNQLRAAGYYREGDFMLPPRP